MAEFVHMKHKDIDTLGGPVTRRAFEGVYKERGWEEASADDVAAYRKKVKAVTDQAAALTEDEIDGIRRRDELDQLALLRGVDPTQHENMDSLRAALKATL